MTIKKNKIIFFLGLYFLIKIFSFYFSPDTPLYSSNPINTFVSALILLGVIYLLIKKNNIGWFIIAGEIILGGGGGYFQILGISLRTLLLLVSISIYFCQNFKFLIFKNNKYNIGSWLLAILLVWGFISALIGYENGHELNKIYSDFIPYFYFLYYFPLRDLLKSAQFKSVVWEMIMASIIGGIIFIIFSFLGFSFGWFELQGNFYHWYRDIALGKITAISTGFFRMTLDEHLLLVPMALYLLGKILFSSGNNNNRNYLLPITYYLLLIILSVNITRIYLVALFIGYLCLFSKKYWQKWIKYGVLTGVIFLVFFSSFNLLSSRGQTFGLELLGLRLGSVVTPAIEDSSMSRMLLFPEILKKIKENPIFGSGLGDTVSVYSPVFKEQITTPHFDWGYLEILAEMGLVGMLIWLSIILFLWLSISRNAVYFKYYDKEGVEYQKYQQLIAPFLSLLLINITSPALFHSLGIIFLVVIFSKIENPKFFSISAGGIIINPHNKIAVVSNFKGSFWTFPKGTVEKGESIKDTALRESKEETGITDLEMVDYFSNYYRFGLYMNKKFLKKMYLFIFLTEKTDELKPVDEYNPEAIWLDIEDVVGKLSHQKDKKIFLKNKYKLTKWKR